jgi:hypothetical protein
MRMRLVSLPSTGLSCVSVWKLEEKGSDVNLASLLLLDAFQSDFEQAIVITNDSDLATPMGIVKYTFKLPVGVWNPHTQDTCDRLFRQFPRKIGEKPKIARPSVELKKVTLFRKNISSEGPLSDVALCQFPSTLSDPAGTFSKPASW